MMKADWDMTPVKGGSGNAFFGKSDQERVFIKKTAVHFCRVFILRESRQKSYGQNVRLKAIPYLLNLGLTVIH